MGLPWASAKTGKMLPSRPAAGGGAPPCVMLGAGLRGTLRSLVEKTGASKGEMHPPPPPPQASEGSAAKTWMWRGERACSVPWRARGTGGTCFLWQLLAGHRTDPWEQRPPHICPPHGRSACFVSQTSTSKHPAVWLGRQPAKLPVKPPAAEPRDSSESGSS